MYFTELVVGFARLVPPGLYLATAVHRRYVHRVSLALPLVALMTMITILDLALEASVLSWKGNDTDGWALVQPAV